MYKKLTKKLDMMLDLYKPPSKTLILTRKSVMLLTINDSILLHNTLSLIPLDGRYIMGCNK